MRLPLPVARALVFLISRPLGRRRRSACSAVARGDVDRRHAADGDDGRAVRLGGLPAERIVPAGGRRRRAVLLLHGGAFLIGSPRTHRVLAAHLAAAVGAR